MFRLAEQFARGDEVTLGLQPGFVPLKVCLAFLPLGEDAAERLCDQLDPLLRRYMGERPVEGQGSGEDKPASSAGPPGQVKFGDEPVIGVGKVDKPRHRTVQPDHDDTAGPGHVADGRQHTRPVVHRRHEEDDVRRCRRMPVRTLDHSRDGGDGCGGRAQWGSDRWRCGGDDQQATRQPNIEGLRAGDLEQVFVGGTAREEPVDHGCLGADLGGHRFFAVRPKPEEECFSNLVGEGQDEGEGFDGHGLDCLDIGIEFVQQAHGALPAHRYGDVGRGNHVLGDQPVPGTLRTDHMKPQALFVGELATFRKYVAVRDRCAFESFAEAGRPRQFGVRNEATAHFVVDGVHQFGEPVFEFAGEPWQPIRSAGRVVSHCCCSPLLAGPRAQPIQRQRDCTIRPDGGTIRKSFPRHVLPEKLSVPRTSRLREASCSESSDAGIYPDPSARFTVTPAPDVIDVSAQTGKDGFTMALVLGAPAEPVARLGIVGALQLLRRDPSSPSVFLGKMEDLPHLDAERCRDALLRRHPRASTPSFQVGDVRGLEVSGIG